VPGFILTTFLLNGLMSACLGRRDRALPPALALARRAIVIRKLDRIETTRLCHDISN